MNLSAEDRLLLCCARTKIEGEMVERARGLLSQGLNWDYLLKGSSSHGITPLVFHNLKMIDRDGVVPNQVLRKFERAYYANVRHNMKIYGELGKILKALQDAEIKVMILKGAAIAETAYQNMALRPIGDIDLLVQEKDFLKIKNELVNLGYEPVESLPRLTPTEAVEYAHYFEQVRFFNEDGMLIETHFRLVNMGIPKVEEMVWQNAVTLKIVGGDALIPSAEDSLLYLCIHANQHNYCMIRLFCDIAELLNRHLEKINWRYFLNIVKQRRLECSIYYTLYFTNQLLGTEIPRDILTELKPGYLRGKLFEFVWGKKRILQLRSMKRPDRTEGPTYYLLELDRMRDKLTYLHKVIFPPLRWLSYHFFLTESQRLYFKHFANLLEKVLKVFAPAKLSRRT
jgi:hypothetical protein